MAAVDEVSQAERRRVLANDQQVAAERRKASTYLAQSQASVDDLTGGRFGAMDKPRVTGTGQVSYPTQPSTSPSNQAALTGDEPPLGYSVDTLEPVGSASEQIEAERVLAKRRGLRRL